MFAYETTITSKDAHDVDVDVEALAIVFSNTQIPVENPDVLVYKDGTGNAKVKIGSTVYPS